MARFKPRFTAPDKSDPNYYSSKNIYTKCGYGLPNCTPMAYGRLLENTGKEYESLTGNAEEWWASADKAGLKKGDTPKLGAIAVWRAGVAGNRADGAGHVATVEEIKPNGDIVTSNSAYNGTLFYMQTVTKASGYQYSKDRPFMGFIYCGVEFDEDVKSEEKIKIGDIVTITSGAVYYDVDKKVPDWVIKKQWVVKDVEGDRVVIDKSTDGKNSIKSAIDVDYLTIVTPNDVSEVVIPTPFMVRVTIPNLNIRKGPGTNFDRTGKFTGVGTFTILEVQSGEGAENGWGRLKSGAGWISLDYVTIK